MSTTSTKRTHAAATADAHALRDLFVSNRYAEWEFAGSVRRRCPYVGDVEHVVRPVFGDVPSPDLFASPTRANLLWVRLDELVAAGSATKHLYGGTGHRWGEKYRGIDYRGHLHEFFTADADNWGPTLAIRTGPAEFSKMLVSGLLRNGLRNKDGHVWRCEKCPQCNGGGNYIPGGRGDYKPCPKCDHTGLMPVEKLSVPGEEQYFSLAGVRYLPPERRGA